MKKLSMRKLSLLGLVLMAASAVTAAIIPSKTEGKLVNGIVDDSTGGGGQQLTCIPQSGGQACTATDEEFTTTTHEGNTSANQDSSDAGAHSSISPE